MNILYTCTGRSDIDECEEFDSCHQTCNNTEGSFFCGCENGFTLNSDDSRTCEGDCLVSSLFVSHTEFVIIFQLTTFVSYRIVVCKIVL